MSRLIELLYDSDPCKYCVTVPLGTFGGTVMYRVYGCELWQEDERKGSEFCSALDQGRCPLARRVSKIVKYCPQHGYPSPCAKCGWEYENEV